MSDESEAAENESEADAAEEAAAAEAEETEETGLQDGDFVRIAYTARTVEDDQLVDTTDQEVADEEDVGDQGEFEPRVIVLGAGHIFGSVEEDIKGKEVGDSGSVTVSAEEAFGEYDREQVRTITADKIPDDDRYPGAQVQIDGEQGYLETIVGGRARVDFNHPLAGENIEYEYEILDVVDDKLERAQGLLGMFLDIDLDMHIQTDEVEEEQVVESDDEDDEGEPETETVTVEKETLYIEATPQLTMNQQWMFQKQQIAQQVMDRVDLDRVIIQETIDGSGMGMMGGMGGMMGGMGGAGGEDIEEALEDADVDTDEILDELDEE
ncbi:FKBP-type peptidyl-prolyl cis-trans isomerase [Halomarina litorea]|uniref:FKBP-type peptidyl-prolyl cis-trans isomerase n=1 Tax=Halomarina litorea TaxID=2961595 RepID=UPI0020C26171|nr:peptidylprolyl isomerase [Halomarina sp. BCD28]